MIISTFAMVSMVKGVQCYELFGIIALKIHTFSFFIISCFPGFFHDFSSWENYAF